jgi:hypothetical protein
VILSGLKSGAQRWEILALVQLLSDFDSWWFEQRRLAYAIESRLLYGVHDAAGTNLDARNDGCNRDSHNRICS